MIKFFRDILDGPLYVVVAILSVIFIMAIIGYLMEKKKISDEEKSRVAIVKNDNLVPPIEPVTIKDSNVINTPSSSVSVNDFNDFHSN